jgi:hypothetical protein
VIVPSAAPDPAEDAHAEAEPPARASMHAVAASLPRRRWILRSCSPLANLISFDG